MMSPLNTNVPMAFRNLEVKPREVDHKKMLIVDEAVVAPTEQVTLSGKSLQDDGPAIRSEEPANSNSGSGTFHQKQMIVDGLPVQTRSLGPADSKRRLDVLTVLDELGVPGVDILASKPGGRYQTFAGTAMSLPGGGHLYTAGANQPASKRAEMVISEAKSQGVTIEEAESSRLIFAHSNETSKADLELFRQETRAAIEAQAQAENLPVDFETFDKIDKNLWSGLQSPYIGTLLLASTPPETRKQFEADVEAWRLAHNAKVSDRHLNS
jgi:hypothetical protein